MPGAEKQSAVPAQLFLQQMLNSAMEENRIKAQPETQAQNLGERLEDHSGVSKSHSVTSDSLQPHGPYSTCNSPGQNTGVDSLFLLHGIFTIQRSNPGLPYCRWIVYQLSHKGSPAVKHPPANAGDIGDVHSSPGSGRSPGGANGNPLQYSCLENPMDRGASWGTVYGVAKSQKQPKAT